MPDPTYDPVKFQALVGVKWQNRYFHIICDAVHDDTEVLLMMQPHHFPGDWPHPGSHQIDYHCPAGMLKQVSGEEFRYICTWLVDIDKFAQPPHDEMS